VERIPGDPLQREFWLQQWADEQELRLGPRPLTWQQKAGRAATNTYRRVEMLSSRLTDRVLDRGLDTVGMTHEPEHDAMDRVAYVPCSWHVLPRALHATGWSERDTFVDFGCGKGRVVHQAACRPFRRVIGVEVAPALAEIARRAIAARQHRHRCSDVEIVLGDATQFDVPDDLTIAFFFDPFRGDTLDTVLRNIVRSIDRRPRPVHLIYVHPSPARQILDTGRFRFVKELRGGLTDRRTSRTAIFKNC
jgi:SAM-dependent methyltransferase